jgi:alpha-N-arabinofuranosidase
MFGRCATAAFLCAALAVGGTARAQTAQLSLDVNQTGPVIHRDIFGQFAEMLGEGIYGGVWVGKDSKIANVRGIRTDVVTALRALSVPVVRWPGGCYADQYHWRDGIGKDRRARVNASWGGVLDPNTFGTDEFMDFAHQIGSEAYVSVNVGSGTVQEAADWLEYLTADGTALAKERAANGHPAPYHIEYVGLGNESWGCGGSMSPDAYVDRMQLFTQFVQNYNPAQIQSVFKPNPDAMKRVAVGPDSEKTPYTEAVMKAWSTRLPYLPGIDGLSLHRYTMSGAIPMMDPATGFGEKGYATFIKKTYGMEDVIATHSAIMDKYDPRKSVALVVDEWGNWLTPMPGRNMLFLKQQNSLRDAITASLNLDIFARHADRVRMANIAQMINVIQSMILTDGPKMVLTPTYYIFKMYVPFQNAQSIPLKLDAGRYHFGDVDVPQVDGIAARGKDGNVWLALTNIDPNQSVAVDVAIQGVQIGQGTGQILTAPQVDAVNSFEAPQTVVPTAYRAQAANNRLTLKLPPKSVIVLKLEP